MNRRPLRFISAISLLLFVLILMLWVRSKWVLDGIDEVVATPWRKLELGVRSAQGRVWFLIGADSPAGGRWSISAPKHFLDRDSDRQNLYLFGIRSGLQTRGWLHSDFGGAVYRDGSFLSRPDVPLPLKIQFLAPDWFLALLASLLPLRWMVVRTRVRRMREAAQCVQCGYDLRASPDRCPECGTAVAQAST